MLHSHHLENLVRAVPLNVAGDFRALVAAGLQQLMIGSQRQRHDVLAAQPGFGARLATVDAAADGIVFFGSMHATIPNASHSNK